MAQLCRKFYSKTLTAGFLFPQTLKRVGGSVLCGGYYAKVVSLEKEFNRQNRMYPTSRLFLYFI